MFVMLPRDGQPKIDCGSLHCRNIVKLSLLQFDIIESLHIIFQLCGINESFIYARTDKRGSWSRDRYLV